MPSPSNWMSALNANTLLCDVVMPGSHDAGVAKTNVELNLGGRKDWVVCQHDGFTTQLNAGCRFFDCRVFMQMQAGEGERPRSLEERLRFGHFTNERSRLENKKGGNLGGYGGNLKSTIWDAVNFLGGVHNRHEFVILRFTHSGCPDILRDALKQWIDEYPVWQFRLFVGGIDNIATMPIAHFRGKVIMVFDGKHTQLDPKLGLHRFVKFEQMGMGPVTGLCTCGKYAESGDMVEVSTQSRQAIRTHVMTHGADHLSFVYFQQTVAFQSIEEATTAPNKFDKQTNKQIPYSGGAHSNLSRFLGEVTGIAQQHGAAFPRVVNVVSHDFVNEETCRKIISCNPNFQW